MNRSPGLIIEPAHLHLLDRNSELLQTGFWGSFREYFGWKAHSFRCTLEDREFYLLVLIRALKLGLKLAYIPYGPQFPLSPLQGPESVGEFLVESAKRLTPFMPKGTVFIRFDPPWGRYGAGNRPEPLELCSGLWKAPMDIQPPSTVLLDLTQTEDEILAGMKPKTRYNIKVSEKKKVEVIEGNIEDLSVWYALYRETARRDRITLHSFEYYKKLFELSITCGCPEAHTPEIKLLLARAGGELLAGIIVALKDQTARYLYGASSNRKRNLMPGYALQWRAIQLAKARGCAVYDMFGIPPANDPAHPMYGLYRFKTGFGGKILNRPGCYDFALSSFWYRIYRSAEAGRALYYRKIRKRLKEIRK